MREPVERLRRLGLFALYPALGILTPLLAMPIIAFHFGTSGWATVAIGQSIGTAGVVFVELAWGLDGPQLVAAATPAERQALFRQAARGRFVAYLGIGLIALAPCAIVRPDEWAVTWVFALSSLAAGVSSAWFLAGISRPGLALLADSLPRATATAVACAGIVLGSGLWVYAVLLTAAGLASPFLASALLGFGLWGPLRSGRTPARRRMSFDAFGARISSSLYLALPTTLVALVASEATVATFSGSDRLMRMGLTALTFIPMSMQASLGKTSEPSLAIAIRRAIVVNLGVGVVAGAIAALALPVVVPIAMSNAISISQNDGVLVGITVFATCTSRGIGSVALVRLRAFRTIFHSALAGAIIGVPLLLILSEHFGATGAFGALAISELIVALTQAAGLRISLRPARPRPPNELRRPRGSDSLIG